MDVKNTNNQAVLTSFLYTKLVWAEKWKASADKQDHMFYVWFQRVSC